MSLTATPYLVLGAILFTMGAVGLLVRRNALVSAALLTLLTVRGVQVTHGAAQAVDPGDQGRSNIEVLGRALFTDYVFAFEVTSVLLVIAVVGAVVLARRAPKEVVD